jgi:hypothetical protein
MPSYTILSWKRIIWNNLKGVNKEHHDFICKLHKFIYGLKQASRAWFHCLSTILLELGFIVSLVDSSLFHFIKGILRCLCLYMSIYNIVVTRTHLYVITALIALKGFHRKTWTASSSSLVFRLHRFPPLVSSQVH